MSIVRENQRHNSLKNITIIHCKNNSDKNINLTYSYPHSQRGIFSSKEKFNASNNHNYFNDNEQCFRNNYAYYCSKKINKRKETPLRKILLNETFLIKNKSSKLIKTSETNFPKNYSYYERKEISNKNEGNNTLINNTNNNKNINNPCTSFFNNNIPFIQNYVNKTQNEIFFDDYMKNIQISKKNDNIKNKFYNNGIIKNIHIEDENNNKKINPIISNQYYTNDNYLNNEDLNDINPKRIRNIILNKKIQSPFSAKKEYNFMNIKNKNIMISVIDDGVGKENICQNILPCKVEESYVMSEKIDKNYNNLKRTKLLELNNIITPINSKSNFINRVNNINTAYNSPNNNNNNNLNQNISIKFLKSNKSFQKFKTNNDKLEKENNSLKIKLRNNSHIKLINKNYKQLHSITKSKNNINQQTKYKTYSEKTSPKSIFHSCNSKTVKNNNTLNQSEQSETINNTIIHQIPRNYKIIEKPREKKLYNFNNLADYRKKSFDSNKRIIYSFSKNSDSNNNIFSNILVKNIKAQSQAGRLEHHHKKINQDTYLIEQNIIGILNFNLFGVLDGHGTNGHYVSKFVAKFIKNKLSTHPKIKYLTDPKKIYQKITENNYQIIENIFLEADKQIRNEHFDSYLSGTTCVIIIQIEEKIICANCGDSRAILIYENKKNNLTNNLKNTKIFALSNDCKPDLPQEKYRIIKSGGTVEQSENEKGEKVGPYRVWEGDKDYPGLAMSRSIGDLAAKKVGVIPNPLFKEFIIDNNSKYLVICSDGVWEFLSNENVMEICNKYYLRNDVNGLCQELIKKATFWWEKEDDVIDDITVVAVFF